MLEKPLAAALSLALVPTAVPPAPAPAASPLLLAPAAVSRASAVPASCAPPTAARPQLEAARVSPAPGGVFDGAGGRSAFALGLIPPAVAAPALWLAAHAPLAPAAYELRRLARLGAARPAPPAPRSPAAPGRLEAARDAAAAVFYLLPVAAVAGVAAATLGPGLPLALALAPLWVLGAGLAQHGLAHERRGVVGGWQASHDQRYRVGGDGLPRDVRGRPYGQDRWDEYAPGEVTQPERSAIRVAAVWAGLLVLTASGAPAPLALLYQAAATALLAAKDRLRP